ncbi:FAD-binding and (Fe-S)-binding domain-containing protein [Carboxylicivirga sp. M1479]|uniref:FAD-binding and (Fe-S)-binding domain-containing protein n=1 Tax=Carboxylicivirga sp. M1479 TaxID=2594476 RepID=UPI001178102E|nr:FAD-binding and (Fe-S)-binding domain-containing protein [Carboxylicivirga sp. M1479]TRX64572.1 FAD-binding protein [Carboxylicivirga sp. M1479]
MELNKHPLKELTQKIKGRVSIDETSKIIYSTDASAYFEKPYGVVTPKDNLDIQEIILFAQKHKLPIIPRAAGTSLAGQVVGSGLIVDIGKYLNKILEVNIGEKWVRVQPGVVLDELNKHLEPLGLFFGPETSTANRCMIGGMVGNNSCGAHSLIYGSTRDHTLELKGYLSNGDEVALNALNKWEFEQKCHLDNFEGHIYSTIRSIISNKENRREIRNEFPHPDIHRRNTGYALDYLINSYPFIKEDDSFNMCKLLAGSEGTLMFTTEIKLKLIDLPPKNKGLVCVHLNSLEEALHANLTALVYKPGAVELMDKAIMDLTKKNVLQNKNRFFVEGDPEALLLVEFVRETKEEIIDLAEQLTQALKRQNFGYAYPVLFGDDINKVWNLRKAGLGVLANMPGDDLPTPVIEDTAVRPEDLPAFIADIKTMLKRHQKECVYYAHIGTGELHLRPILNMKNPKDIDTFYKLAKETAQIVKKYKGSLSGEHGDGRLRGEFIPIMVGNHNYKLFKDIKLLFDPNNIFNPGKITDTPNMNTSLRYKKTEPNFYKTVKFDWASTQGFVRAAEKCNGSGDCRKSHIIGGTMCPSYMGSLDESQTTRARANMLREFFAGTIPNNKLGYDEVKNILDLCLSCKACKSECPSNVDMTKLKAEFLNSYHNEFGIPLRSRIIANHSKINEAIVPLAYLYNIATKSKLVKNINEKILGFSSKRRLPALAKQTLAKWHKQQKPNTSVDTVYLFADEFTNYHDTNEGIASILLLEKIGYRVIIPKHKESGRTYLSKGLLKEAAEIANHNVSALSSKINKKNVLIGIEPSAILTFRDEYPELVSQNLQPQAKELAKHCYTFEEFIDREFSQGKINKDVFTSESKHIKFHAHCYQKALSNTSLTKNILEIPRNYTAEEIPSGCCGMAGSIGYEKEHYNLSMKIGELILFPEIRKTKSVIAASGTSCRHQIKDGTNVAALHPATILYKALKK